MNSIIQYLYDFDETDQTYIIKISTKNYLDLFNKLDYNPIRKKDIDVNVINYIEDCSSDIPLHYKVKMEISIAIENRNEDLEKRTIKGIKNNFIYVYDYYKKSSTTVIKNSLQYVLFFGILTACSFWLETIQINFNQIFFKTIMEGLSIGSWVFLWEAIAGILMRNKPNRNAVKMYKRLIESTVYFSYC